MNLVKQIADQVLDAIELLLAGFEQAAVRCQSGTSWLQLALEAPHDHLYRGLLSVVLRAVFFLYSEARGLFPSGHASVLRLYEDLSEDTGSEPNSMRERFGAYGRLLALFRRVFIAAPSADVVPTTRQTSLFDPSSFPFLEGVEIPPPIDDAVTYAVLHRLIVVEGQRLNYGALEVEQIGSIYESLMGYNVVRTRSAAVRIGKNAVWVEVEDLSNRTPSVRKKWLKEVCGLSTSQQKKVEVSLREAPDHAALLEALHALSPGPKHERARHRVLSGKLVLQPGDARRRSGSHYTPRTLTARIVRRTLQPVLACLGHAPTAEQILSLTVCDPAMGSGAFLVEACRQLGAQLVAAWARESRIEAIAQAHGNPILHARGLVAQRCLYGVDKNETAVELAKLSLWLVTMRRELPFTFVDHALRHGDALVGLDPEQIARFHWRREESLPTLAAVLDALEQANPHNEVGDLVTEHEQVGRDETCTRLNRAERAIDRARTIADLCVGAFFYEVKTTAREDERARRQALVERWLAGDTEVEPTIRALADEVREHLAPFHWWLEFPEVFAKKKSDPCNQGQLKGGTMMTAVVGNPPFLGGKRISEVFGRAYNQWLCLRGQAQRNADLSAHFFRRAAQLVGLHGSMGLIATNTICQGDTRKTGLKALISQGWILYEATQSTPWPGDAAVTIRTVIGARGAPASHAGVCLLNGVEVQRINSRLRGRPERADALALRANRGLAYQGCITRGKGFIIPVNRSQEFSVQSRRRLKPYIGGDEVNDRPTQNYHRYVIDLNGLEFSKASQWQDLVGHLDKTVRSERLQSRDAKDFPWWHWWRPRLEMRAAIARILRCLVVSRVSKHLAFTFQPSDRIFSEALYVFPLDSMTAFATVQSRVHVRWAWLHSSTMRDAGIRYTASNCFDSFPFPRTDPRAIIPKVEAAGREFYEARSAHMTATNRGLTKTYNALKDPGRTDTAILRLRRLTEAMDRAVLDAYGWIDIVVPPFCPRTRGERAARQEFEDEVIERLYVLNAERAAEEQTG